jgi:hypothetical protein
MSQSEPLTIRLPAEVKGKLEALAAIYTVTEKTESGIEIV